MFLFEPIIINGILFTVWETEFLEDSPKNSCPLCVPYKILLAQANFLLTQVKMDSHWWVGERECPSLIYFTSFMMPYVVPKGQSVKSKLYKTRTGSGVIYTI